MNKLFIYFLYRITFIALILFSIAALIEVVVTAFDLPHIYITSKTKGGGSYITLAKEGNIVPMKLQIRVLNDTIVRYSKKGTGNYGEFPIHDKEILKNSLIEEVRQGVIKNVNEMDLDTIVGSLEPSFPDKHPFKEGFKNKEELRTGEEIDRLDSYAYPIDTFATNPIIAFKDIKTTYANVEVKAYSKRDRILLSIPEWINRILTFLLLYQLFKIFKNIQNDVVFDIKNVKRIQLIGFIMIGFFVETFFSNYLYQNYIISGFHHTLRYIPSFKNPDYQGISINFNVWKEFNFTNLYMGLITLILATIFKRGLDLQQEQDLTV
jgi:Protein of unknown function (DUF2975)